MIYCVSILSHLSLGSLIKTRLQSHICALTLQPAGASRGVGAEGWADGDSLQGRGSRVPISFLGFTQRVQNTYMVQSMVFVVVTSLMVWVSMPYMGSLDPLGKGFLGLG